MSWKTGGSCWRTLQRRCSITIMSARPIWGSDAMAFELQRRNAHAGRASHEGRRVLVTGGGKGIGEAIAHAFGARGATVGVADLDGEAAQSTATTIRNDGGSALALALDVADWNAVSDGLARIARDIGGPFDTVINNAGISPKHEGVAHKVWEMDPEEWNRVVAVNLTGSFNTIRAVTP